MECFVSMYKNASLPSDWHVRRYTLQYQVLTPSVIFGMHTSVDVSVPLFIVSMTIFMYTDTHKKHKRNWTFFSGILE